MQLNVTALNADLSYSRRRLDICKLLTLSIGQNGRKKQLKRVGKQCCPRLIWVRPGRTSAWWDNFVNPHWIRSESEYVWTGEFDMNTLWSYNVWTWIFSYPERKSCGLKNIRIRVDGASIFYFKEHFEKCDRKMEFGTESSESNVWTLSWERRTIQKFWFYRTSW